MIKALDRLLCSLENVMIVVLTLAGLVMAFLQVVLRYVFNTGIHWLEAGLITALVWAMLFGASRAVREGLHPRVELLPHLAGPRTRALLNFLGLAAALALSVYFLWDSIFFAHFVNMINALHPELGIKQVYPFLIVPIITAMLTLRYGLLLWVLFSKPDAMSADELFRAQTAPAQPGYGAE